MSYLKSKFLPWLSAAITSATAGIVGGLAPMFLSGGATFNFSSEYNTMLILKNVAICTAFSFLCYLAKSPIPTPEDDK